VKNTLDSESPAKNLSTQIVQVQESISKSTLTAIYSISIPDVHVSVLHGSAILSAFEQSALSLDLDLVVRCDYHLRSFQSACSCGRAGLGLVILRTKETMTKPDESKTKLAVHDLRHFRRQFSNSSQGFFVDEDDRGVGHTCGTKKGMSISPPAGVLGLEKMSRR
jgi:hypothetical protein